ncbi:stage II sporulation protein E [Leptospira ryugenii]|uniref:Stage II sporulation protein E n=1 Tax=Leptospira ryugenii TaxID=1917863 RepID=A0A2P2DX36_9LEPT|nr:PP2C family protein-serine/threonine phosphatase [Leptospira ryugenii]GBF49193.1 stage II sporulation protein E [Leptospira ryugenii]
MGRLKFLLFPFKLEILKTPSFLKLFFSLVVFIVLPYAILISIFIYQNYKEILDWNYRFQLTRVQLMSIDLENQIRDQLLTFSKERTHIWKGSRIELSEEKNFSMCLKDLYLSSIDTQRSVQLFYCPKDKAGKNWILLTQENVLWIYSANFLEDSLLANSFSDPEDQIFLINQDSNFGISSEISDQFQLSEDWSKRLLGQLSGEHLPIIKEIEILDKTFFLSSFPMYGLPFTLYVASPKENVLRQLKENYRNHLVLIINLFLISLFFSAFISGRELEDKRKLSIVFREFPHAALLYDAEGNELLSNPNLESKIDIRSLEYEGESVYHKVAMEARKFISLARDTISDNTKSKMEEWETLYKDGEKITLAVEFHLWFLENASQDPRGSLIIIEDISAKKLEFEKEMVYAKILQKKYLPEKKLSIPELDYDLFYLPLLHVSGDYYDFLKLSDQKYLFVLADIVGHGVQAAMMMTVCKVLFHQIVDAYDQPSDILERMNLGVRGHFPEASAFVPLHFLYFDFSQMMVYYANAGHPGVFYLKASGEAMVIEKLNPLLGMFPKIQAKVISMPLQRKDRFYLYTDGLSDVRNPEGEAFGTKVLPEFLRQTKDLSIAEIKKALQERIKDFAKGTPAIDDITWIGIEIQESV